MTIRPAVIADVPRIVEMGLTFLRESSYRSVFLENAQQVAALAERLIGSENGDVLLVQDRETIVGMIGMIAFEHFISGQRTASEVVYWVDASSRGCGVRLLRAAEAWAKAHGATLMQMISPTERVDTLYARLGYAPVERIFQRSL